MSRVRIACVEEVAEGRTLKFQFRRDGISREGFLARSGGTLVAFENVCRHLPLSLDHGGNRFFSEDGCHFVCQNHGAMFDPATGLCLKGPCEGARLFALPVEVINDEVWLTPDSFQS